MYPSTILILDRELKSDEKKSIKAMTNARALKPLTRYKYGLDNYMLFNRKYFFNRKDINRIEAYELTKHDGLSFVCSANFELAFFFEEKPGVLDLLEKFSKLGFELSSLEYWANSVLNNINSYHSSADNAGILRSDISSMNMQTQVIHEIEKERAWLDQEFHKFLASVGPN